MNECWWPEDPTGQATLVSHDAAVQIALERRRVADELDRERRENVRLRADLRDAWVALGDVEHEISELHAILARVNEPDSESAQLSKKWGRLTP